LLIFKWWRIVLIIIVLPLPQLPRRYGHFAEEEVLDVVVLVVVVLVVVIVTGVGKGRSIDGGMDGSSAPVADFLRHRLLQRGEDEGDLNGGRSTGNG
jgi:hypothetical protein